MIVALPILLGLLVSPRPLEAAAMAGRRVNVVSGNRSAMPAAVQAAASKASTERTVLDWSQSFQTVADPAALRRRSGRRHRLCLPRRPLRPGRILPDPVCGQLLRGRRGRGRRGGAPAAGRGGSRPVAA
ncbi:MAG: hypothetical protein R3A10_21725 [Caldilineaceae bacterium]